MRDASRSRKNLPIFEEYQELLVAWLSAVFSCVGPVVIPRSRCCRFQWEGWFAKHGEAWRSAASVLKQTQGY